MAAIDFPNAPAMNQQHTVGFTTWQWDGTAWNIVPQMGPIYIGDLPPANPAVGQKWWKSSTGQEYIWFDDGSSKQWVQSAGGTIAAEPYPFTLADMLLRSDAAGRIGVSPKKDGSVGSVLTLDNLGALTISNAFLAGGQVKTNSGHFISTTAVAILAPTGLGTVYMRPRGVADGAAQAYLDSNGRFAIGSTGADPLYISGPNGASCRANFTVAGVRTWTCGAAANGNFWIADETGAVVILNMGYSGNPYTTLSNHLTITGSAWKPGGGVWADSSDIRIKNIVGEYDAGLDEIKALQIRRYTYKGNDTFTEGEPSPHQTVAEAGTEYIGLIAQEVEAIFPGMITKRPGFIDDQPTDILQLDTTNLIYALINAVKDLSARIQTLEARQ